MSVMTLVDKDRLWIKSGVGMVAGSESSRDEAFCAHTILEHKGIVVNDMLDDKRFADNPLVTPSKIRFYVGMTLITLDGFLLGSLCAMDSVSRELSPQQMKALNTLAKQVVKNMELRASYARVRAMAAQLTRVDASKDRMFNLVSHVLKSPFSGVLGLLERLLQWSTFESGEMPYRPERQNVDDVLNGVVALLHDIAERKSIRLKALPSASVAVKADHAMMHSTIQNLVGNALKFTPPSGSVSLSSRVLGDWVEICVTDTGVGMSAASLQKILGRESGQTTFGTAGEAGTGLGLNLSQSFVKKHGGTFVAESKINKGTTFRFTLPRAV